MYDRSKEVIAAIREYQETGAANDFDPTDFKQEGVGVEWSDHVPGTAVYPGGRIFLGLPRGFNRLGPVEGFALCIFRDWDNLLTAFRGQYGKFNVPVWKHLDKNGNTLVRGLSPRINQPFLHIIIGDVRDKIDCLEITAADIAEMD